VQNFLFGELSCKEKRKKETCEMSSVFIETKLALQKVFAFG
jgi:hypothetical protein